MKLKLLSAGLLCLTATALLLSTAAGQTHKSYTEPHRPQFHFSPGKNWMNDPNGMVYVNGVYHLFFQYNPAADVPGNIHWGHATSRDLMHWQEQPVALSPDRLGLNFSGSAVLDENNTSGLGSRSHPPMIALYTSHSEAKEKAGRTDVETQSMAYSTDNGKTWKKYQGNPVISNGGSRDFRDPKVTWYEPEHKWVVAISAHDHVEFYSSKNLIKWSKESEFGQKLGAHGGVWECPDLTEVTDGLKKRWLLIVNINPGGPNGGSATQYFTGNFDGKTFTPEDTTTRWIDYGPDNYAGVTWSNTGKRKIFLGWMSNWVYGTTVPTHPWRSAMTIPRELGFATVNGKHYVTSQPVKELKAITGKGITWNDVKISGSYALDTKSGPSSGGYIIRLKDLPAENFSIVLANTQGEQVTLGYLHESNNFYIDRSHSGQTGFQRDFAKISYAPRIATGKKTDLILVVDAASVELFADGGLTNMTGIFFPSQPLTRVTVKAPGELKIGKISYAAVKSVWR